MKLSTSCGLLLLTALSLAFAPAPLTRKPKAALLLLADVQGTWEMTEGFGDARAPDTRIFARVRGNTWTYVFKTGTAESDGTPSEIALGAPRGNSTADLGLTCDGGNVLRGVVKVEGDVLTVRPRAGEREGDAKTMIFRRVK